MQRAFVMLESMAVSVDLPPPEQEVLPGVTWGLVEAFPSPAYWAYQVMARRIEARSIKYRLGRTLREEVGACLLGGHGIPARIGLLAFEHLKAKGAFDASSPSEPTLREWLSEPINVDGRSIRYRFAAQKARYLAAALARLATESTPMHSGRALRDWLTGIPGVGFKTASWIARNWLDADDVAILDIHIQRAGVLAKFLDAELTVGALRYHGPMLASKLVARSEQHRRTTQAQKDVAVVRAVLDGVRSWSAGNVTPIAKKPLLRMLRRQTGLPKEKLRKAIQRLLRDQVT